jgi:hypothetical protein
LPVNDSILTAHEGTSAVVAERVIALRGPVAVRGGVQLLQERIAAAI